jgi:hypothetical protein
MINSSCSDSDFRLDQVSSPMILKVTQPEMRRDGRFFVPGSFLKHTNILVHSDLI